MKHLTLQDKLDAATAELSSLPKRVKELEASLAEQQAEQSKFCYENCRKDPKVFRFYTGIEVGDFEDVLRLPPWRQCR